LARVRQGGAAWIREKIDDAFTDSLFGIPVDPGETITRTGWTAGAGVEWAFAPHWSATLEYDYYDFGSKGAVLATSTRNVTVSIFSLRDTMHTATVGLNYHF
jgi:outer membrane immunogenic protein